MSRTRATTVIALLAVGAALGILLQLALAAGSQPKFRPEYSLAVTLALIGVIVVALALPVRRVVRGRGRVDPFYATRVVLLAKASALAGALLAGVGAGLLIELLLRSTAPGDDTVARTLAALGGAVVLLVGGLVGEWFCTVPPADPDDDEPNGLDTGRLEP